jgi:hypothetical protein
MFTVSDFTEIHPVGAVMKMRTDGRTWRSLTGASRNLDERALKLCILFVGVFMCLVILSPNTDYILQQRWTAYLCSGHGLFLCQAWTVIACKVNEKKTTNALIIQCIDTQHSPTCFGTLKCHYHGVKHDPAEMGAQCLEKQRWTDHHAACYNIQGPALNTTHFESRITHLLYTVRNTTEHG